MVHVPGTPHRTDYPPPTRNPDPRYFTIKDVQYINGFTLVSVKYDNCPQFEGNKILVFKGDFRMPLYGIKEIDPHFAKDHKMNLVARFISTDEGVDMAKTFCSAFGKDKITYRSGEVGDRYLCNDGAPSQGPSGSVRRGVDKS